MPLVDVTMAEGGDPERVVALIRELHDAVRRTLDVTDDSIRVEVREVPPTHWATVDPAR